MTPLATLLGIRHPLLLAPMAGVSGGRLAAATSRAGGLGFVGAGYGDRDWLALQLSVTEGQRIGVGFITWSLRRQPELLDMALAFVPAAVLLSFGDMGGFADQVRRAGVTLIAQVQTVKQARDAAAAGAQVIVAQGGEAGGHGGLRGTMALVPAVVDAVAPLPVVAAGGIADGRGIAAALMLGAQGVLCGTAFYACNESLAHPEAKRRLVAASGDDTFKGPLFDQLRGLDWPEGPWGLRALRNAISEQLGTRWAADPQARHAELAIQQARLAHAREAGDFDTAPVIAGEAADLVHTTSPAAAVVQALMLGCDTALGRAAAITHRFQPPQRN
jgi:nitronate monooxygenase